MSAVHSQAQLISSISISGHNPCKRRLGSSNIISFLKPHKHNHSSSTRFIKPKLGCTPPLIHTTLKAALPFNIAYHLRAFEYHPAPSFKYHCETEDVNHYYAALDHNKGEALKRKLHSIISNHKSLPYREVWEALKILDVDEVDMPEASSGIQQRIMMLLIIPGEHLWRRSYGLTSGPSLTDLHNIRPADVNGKITRGNKFFGECESKLRKCLKPANKEAAPDTMTDNKSWTPPMQVRGDIARSLMYMAVRLSDSPNIGNREMGILSTLLRWNHMDPPSKEEKLRNERVCRIYQHNRNPFIDHQESADLDDGGSLLRSDECWPSFRV